MNIAQETRLSILIDGELTSDHIASFYAALAPDPGLRATWERYHLIGQVLRGEPVSREVRGVAAAVRARTDVLPNGPPRPVAAVPARAWRTLFAGAALAATAALLTLFVVPGRYREMEPMRAAASALVGPVAGGEPRHSPAVRRWDTDRSDLVGTLDRFLVNHQEAAPACGARGMLPYATLIGYAAPR
ncbi:sigma-E factor negative regulatory protein [uncultured Thiodictyon sp.]|uniref:sigma-E factor negative regulatory protein n=1 Tax=uncultured Thiodictyon sp. TaxID=1846217 RepID=UPI0025F25C96|nr:sigma-E factor negative regulatory protein [uncultured Thiodictyon sp.]